LGIRHAHDYDDLTDAELLVKVKRGWRCDETPCGTGSTIRNSSRIRTALPLIFEQYNIQSVVDAGAGDLHWAKLVDWPDYQGFDLYPRHKDVKQLDITKQVLPKADLVICRHVLNHLSIKMAEQALGFFAMSGAKYLLMTMCDNQQAYWKEHGLTPPEPEATFIDCQHWWLELHRLN